MHKFHPQCGLHIQSYISYLRYDNCCASNTNSLECPIAMEAQCICLTCHACQTQLLGKCYFLEYGTVFQKPSNGSNFGLRIFDRALTISGNKLQNRAIILFCTLFVIASSWHWNQTRAQSIHHILDCKQLPWIASNFLTPLSFDRCTIQWYNTVNDVWNIL